MSLYSQERRTTSPITNKENFFKWIFYGLMIFSILSFIVRINDLRISEIYMYWEYNRMQIAFELILQPIFIYGLWVASKGRNKVILISLIVTTLLGILAWFNPFKEDYPTLLNLLNALTNAVHPIFRLLLEISFSFYSLAVFSFIIPLIIYVLALIKQPHKKNESKPKVIYKDVSENSFFVKVFTGITFGCWAATPMFFLSKATSDGFATALWAITVITIAVFTVKKLKAIRLVLNLNVLIYSFSGMIFFKGGLSYLAGFVTLTMALTSLVIRLRLKKVHVLNA